MKGKVKLFFVLSLLLNGVLLAIGGVAIDRLGGASFLMDKLHSTITAEESSPFPPNYIHRDTLFESLPSTDGSIVFLGDSLTNGNEWSEIFHDVRIVNRGIHGDDTVGILNRLNNIVEAKPSKIFIMIGTNDIGIGRDVSDIVTNYEEILETIQNESPTTDIFIQSVLPVNQDMIRSILRNNITENSNIETLNNELKSIADIYSATYIDLFPLFLNDINQLDQRFTSDGLHINGEGYVVWKEAIEEFID